VIVVADTHSLVWFLTGNPRLSPNAKTSLSDFSNLLIIPSIDMLEVRYLYDRKRISISFEEVLEKIETSENVVIHPLNMLVATFVPQLSWKSTMLLSLEQESGFRNNMTNRYTSSPKMKQLPNQALSRLYGDIRESENI